MKTLYKEAKDTFSVSGCFLRYVVTCFVSLRAVVLPRNFNLRCEVILERTFSKLVSETGKLLELGYL